MSDEKVTPLSQVLNAALTKDNLETLLKDWDRYNKIFDRVNETITKLDRIGILPVIIRGVGKKYDIDVDKPLNDPLAIQAASSIHKLFFSELNQVPEDIVKQMYQQALKASDSASITKPAKIAKIKKEKEEEKEKEK